MALEAHVREYFEHLAVLTEHVGLEFRYAVRVGDESEMFEQQGADAVSLEFVANRERDFCAMRIVPANITTNADEALAPILSQRRGQSDMTLEIEFSYMLQILRRQVAPDSHESKVDGLLAEASEMIVQTLLIVGMNRSNPHRSAIEHPDINAIFPRVDQHVAIFPQHHTCTHAISPRP